MGRWKVGPQGAYYDPNDVGPDQVVPPTGDVNPSPTPDPSTTDRGPDRKPPANDWPNGGIDGYPKTNPNAGTNTDVNALRSAWFSWADHSPAGLRAFAAAHRKGLEVE